MKHFILLLLMTNISYAQTQIGQDIDGLLDGDRSGWSVSISGDGNIVAIGSPESDSNGGSSGQVSVFENQNNNWIQLGDNLNGEGGGDDSGWSVSLNEDGTILAIGAPLNNGNGANSGHVRIFEFIAGNWVQIGDDINSEVPPSFDRSGWSVSLSADGSIVAIGATNNNDNGTNAGHVRVFQNQANSWVQLGGDIDGEAQSDLSGTAVSLSADGTTIAIGAPNNQGNGFDSGHVRVYNFQGGSWVQLGNDIDGEMADDLSGSAVSLDADGSILAIGSPQNDDNGSGSGHVRVYEYQTTNWVQLGNTIVGENAGDLLGTSLSLNNDGTILAMGAPLNSDSDVSAGHVRVYRFESNNWTQIGNDIDGEASAQGSQSGSSVSLSSDGTKVVVGAPFASNGSVFTGHARVYDLSPILSINEATVTSNIKLYPNPSKSRVNLRLNNNIELKKMELYDSLGNMVLNTKSSAFDINHLSAGLYLVKVYTIETVANLKLIVE